MENKEEKKLLRQKMCQARLALSTHAKEDAAKKLCKIIINSKIFQQAQHLALYWPYNAEINPMPILEAAITLNKYCYLPILHPKEDDSLLFMPYHNQTTLKLNKYGIPEPDYNYKQAVPLEKLSIIFMPLVAFDANGHRLGMGGGYYDATLARIQELSKQPFCLGLAYAMQEVAMIPQDHWDVKLDGVATEIECRMFSK